MNKILIQIPRLSTPNIYRVDKNKCKTFPVFVPTTIRSILTASPLSRQLIPFMGMCVLRRIIGTTINPELIEIIKVKFAELREQTDFGNK